MMDDILAFKATKSEHNERLRAVLERLVAAGVTLNRAKCAFGVREVSCLGYVVGASGIRPDPKKVQAIKEMATPATVSDMRRFLVMINYLARFVPNLVEISAPQSELLLRDREGCWGSAQQKAFDSLKELLFSAKSVAKFDPKLPTVVSSDASSLGIGAVLMQAQPDGQKRPVAFLSRSLTQVEYRYAQIEKEAR